MNNDAITVTDTPIILFGDTLGSGETRLLIRNVGGFTAYIGGTAVDTNSMPLEDGELFDLTPARRQDELWAVCDTGETTEIRVMWG